MANAVACGLVVISALFLLLSCDQIDAEVLVQVVVQFVLAFGTLALLFSLLSRLYSDCQAQDQRSPSSVNRPTLEETSERRPREEDNKEQRDEGTDETAAATAAADKLQESRDRLQQEYSSQAADYNERILQPKLEAKKKKKEEEFMRFMGPAWKGERHKLGSPDEDYQPRRIGPDNEGSSREAADSRQLPDEVLNPPTPPTDPPKIKRVISLPDEPAEGTTDSVNIAFRTPITRVLRRRFLSSDTVQLLLDYVTTCGFSQRVYNICTSYPRQNISANPEQTLRDIGITSDTTLYLEDKQ